MSLCIFLYLCSPVHGDNPGIVCRSSHPGDRICGGEGDCRVAVVVHLVDAKYFTWLLDQLDHTYHVNRETGCYNVLVHPGVVAEPVVRHDRSVTVLLFCPRWLYKDIYPQSIIQRRSGHISTPSPLVSNGRMRPHTVQLFQTHGCGRLQSCALFRGQN